MLKIAFWEEEGCLDHCSVVEVTALPPQTQIMQCACYKNGTPFQKASGLQC